MNVAQMTADATYLTSGTVSRTIGYAYDAASQLVGVTDPAAEYDYAYDQVGRLTAETQDIDGLTPLIEFAHAWNAAGRRTSLAAEIGGTADFKNDYAYDGLSRLTQVIQQDVGGGNVVADKRVDFAYNAAGQYTSITRYQHTGTSNLVATTSFAYDTRNRLTDLDHKQGGTDLALYDYTYDAMDRITEIDSSIDGISTFSYDKEGQLTAADHASPLTDESYSFDATGNRTGGSYSVATNNRTTAGATYTYTYDSEGNRATRTKTSDSSYEEYTWDHRNRLTKVTFKNSGGTVLKTVEYAYDAFNRLVRRTYDADGPGGAAAVDSFFAYDGTSINPSLDFDGAAASDLARRHLWGPAVDQIMASEEVSSLSAAGNVLWALTDHLGTVRDIADFSEGSGTTTVANHRFYDSFGNLKSETNAAVDFLFGYTAKYFDEVTAIGNHWARWYDSQLGKWLSHDPSGFTALDANLSRNVFNDPVNFVDPTGYVALRAGSNLNSQFYAELGLPNAHQHEHNVSFGAVKAVEAYEGMVSFIPLQGLLLDIYNARAGKDLLGRTLSPMQRAIACVSIVTAILPAPDLSAVGTAAVRARNIPPPPPFSHTVTRLDPTRLALHSPLVDAARRTPVRTSLPLMHQGSANTCSANCVGMVLAQLKPTRTVTHLGQAGGLAPGASAAKIAAALTANGLPATVQKGLTIQAIQAITSTGRPIIAAIWTGSSAHAVIIDSIRAASGQINVILRDPAAGKAFSQRRPTEARLVKMHAAVA